MTERTYLTTSFKEKDRVKAFSARWDSSAGKWYVPTGLDLVPFATWLPSGAANTELDNSFSSDASSSRELTTQVTQSSCLTLHLAMRLPMLVDRQIGSPMFARDLRVAARVGSILMLI